PPREQGSKTSFDPGDGPFGLWVANDGFDDGGVFSQPGLVSRVNQRLAKQPYKAMIYPNRDKASGKPIPNSYLIGWEYSTKVDLQAVVGRVATVVLVSPTPWPARPSLSATPMTPPPDRDAIDDSNGLASLSDSRTVDKPEVQAKEHMISFACTS